MVIFDRIIIKIADNQDRHKSSDEFDFGPLVSMARVYVFFEMRFDLGTLDLGERSLPFRLVVNNCFVYAHFSAFKWEIVNYFMLGFQSSIGYIHPPSDQNRPWHPPSLIRVFAVRLKKVWVFSYPLSEKRRLIRLGGCPDWSESSLVAHASLLVLSWGGSFVQFAQKHSF